MRFHRTIGGWGDVFTSEQQEGMLVERYSLYTQCLIGTLDFKYSPNTRLGYQLGLFPNEHNYSKHESANRS